MTEAALDRQKLAAARLWAAARMPYLASALFACTVRADPGLGTIGVDRAWQVHADPDVCRSWRSTSSAACSST